MARLLHFWIFYLCVSSIEMVCIRVPDWLRAHTWCPWGVDLSLGSEWLWSEWKALIFKHMLLRERDGKWFMIYTVVSQLKRATLRKDSMIPPCLGVLLSSCSYKVWLLSCSLSPMALSFSWLFLYFFTASLLILEQVTGLEFCIQSLLGTRYQGSTNVSLTCNWLEAQKLICPCITIDICWYPSIQTLAQFKINYLQKSYNYKL